MLYSPNGTESGVINSQESELKTKLYNVLQGIVKEGIVTPYYINHILWPAIIKQDLTTDEGRKTIAEYLHGRGLNRTDNLVAAVNFCQSRTIGYKSFYTNKAGFRATIDACDDFMAIVNELTQSTPKDAPTINKSLSI